MEEKENSWFSLISPRFAYKYDLNIKKYKLYKLKKGLRVNNISVNNSKNFDYIWDFNSFKWLDKKYLIEIFESEYKDWFINRLNSLYKRRNGKYEWFNINEQIVLKICISFPETFYKLQHSDNNGCKFEDWCEFIWIWWGDKELIKDFYENVRCELYHFWSIKWNRYIDYQDNENSSKIIYKKWESNCINLREFINCIKKNIDEYKRKLETEDEMYEIFEKIYVKDLDSYLS